MLSEGKNTNFGSSSLRKKNKILKETICELIQKGVTAEEIILYAKSIPKELPFKIPISIFDNETLSSLESIVKYLKENCMLSNHEIATILNRDDRTIWQTYSRAKSKYSGKLMSRKGNSFPIDLLTDRSLGVLEHISVFLKEKHNLSFHQIALLMHRDDRTIWTSYNRAKKR